MAGRAAAGVALDHNHPASDELRLALNEIRVRGNVRELDSEHVDNLAQSIALRGLIVRPVDGLTSSSPAITASPRVASWSG